MYVNYFKQILFNSNVNNNFIKGKVMKNKAFNYTSPTPTELSFREIIKDNIEDVDVKKLIHVLKNVRQIKSRPGMPKENNIFNNTFISKTERCKVDPKAIRNPLTKKEFGECQFGGQPYRETLPGVVIPITLQYDHHIEKARLVISVVPNHPVVVAVQHKISVKDKHWITQYSKQSRLLDDMFMTIYDSYYYDF